MLHVHTVDTVRFHHHPRHNILTVTESDPIQVELKAKPVSDCKEESLHLYRTRHRGTSTSHVLSYLDSAKRQQNQTTGTKSIVSNSSLSDEALCGHKLGQLLAMYTQERR